MGYLEIYIYLSIGSPDLTSIFDVTRQIGRRKKAQCKTHDLVESKGNR